MIRLATVADAAQIRTIYAPYVTDTVITFETTIPTVAEFEARIAHTLPTYPYLVWEEDGTILGYAYAGRVGARAAFDWSVELSIYLSVDATGKGIGKALYAKLLALLTAQGYYRAYGLIARPNPTSEQLHQRFGFSQVSLQHGVGFKLGHWVDLVWYEKVLCDNTDTPQPPRPITAVLSLLQEDF